MRSQEAGGDDMDLQMLAQSELSQVAGFTLIEDGLCCKEEDLLAKMQDAVPSPATLILWRRQELVWGTWDGHAAELSDGSAIEPRLVLELRLFNETEELHLTRCGKAFRGRHVRDLPAGETADGARAWDRTDLLARFWGHETADENCPRGYVTLEDKERDIEMKVPCAQPGADDYGLLTRNYVGTACEETGQAGYVDVRFVAILPMAKAALDALREV